MFVSPAPLVGLTYPGVNMLWQLSAGWVREIKVERLWDQELVILNL